MKKTCITPLAVSGLLLAANSLAAQLVVYDDFSTNNLSSWVDGTGTETLATVSNQELTWADNDPGFGVEELTSTKDDFDLTASVANPLRVSVDIIAFTAKSDDTSFDVFNLGFVDDGGDELNLKYNYRGTNASQSDAIMQFEFNNSTIGGNTGFSNFAYDDGDTMIFEYDGATIRAIRDSGAGETTIASRSFSDPAFSGDGEILMAANFTGASTNGSSWTLDNVATQTIPEPSSAVFLIGAAAALLGLSRRRR